MKITCSSDLNNKKSWSGIQHEHDENLTHHKNDFLNSDRSKYLRQFNERLDFFDYDQAQENFYGAFVEKHDLNQSKDSRKYKTVKNYLAQHIKKVNPYQLFMGKFADKDSWDTFRKEATEKVAKSRNLSQKEAEKVVFETVRDGLHDYLSGYNSTHPFMPMTGYRIDMDEDGAPHFHSQILNHGQTAKGKPSTSLNSAIKAQLLYNGIATGNSSQNMRAWRDIEDHAIFNSVTQKVIENIPEMGKKPFEFYRKKDAKPNIATGQKHEEYKRNAQVLQDQQNLLDAVTAKVDAKKTELADKQKQVDDKQSEYDSLFSDVIELTNSVKTAKNDKKEAEEKAKKAMEDKQQSDHDAILAKSKAQTYQMMIKNQLYTQRHGGLVVKKDEKGKLKTKHVKYSLDPKKPVQDVLAPDFTYFEGFDDLNNRMKQREEDLDAREKAVSAREQASNGLLGKIKSAVTDGYQAYFTYYTLNYGENGLMRTKELNLSMAKDWASDVENRYTNAKKFYKQLKPVQRVKALYQGFKAGLKSLNLEQFDDELKGLDEPIQPAITPQQVDATPKPVVQQTEPKTPVDKGVDILSSQTVTMDDIDD